MSSTILVVDDEIGPRESLRAVFKPDYRVLTATQGEQALRVVEEETVDIVLLDLRMPGLSGIQVLEKIKAIDPSIEVIVVTGYTSYETVLEGLRLHAFDYIPKPFDVVHLRETVRRAVRSRGTSPSHVQSQPLDLTSSVQSLLADVEAHQATLAECIQRLLSSQAGQLTDEGQKLVHRLQETNERLRQRLQAVEDLTEMSTDLRKPSERSNT